LSHCGSYWGGGETVGDLRRGAARASLQGGNDEQADHARPCAGFGLALAGCGGSGAIHQVGIGGPITGSDAAFGSQLKMGAEQAIADSTRPAGFSQENSFTIATTWPIPSKASRSPTSSPPDGVKFVMGPLQFRRDHAGLRVYQENGILEVTPSATNPRITERNMWNIFRPAARDDQQGAVAGEYIAANFRARRSRSSTTRPPTARVSPTKPRRP